MSTSILVQCCPRTHRFACSVRELVARGRLDLLCEVAPPHRVISWICLAKAYGNAQPWSTCPARCSWTNSTSRRVNGSEPDVDQGFLHITGYFDLSSRNKAARMAAASQGNGPRGPLTSSENVRLPDRRGDESAGTDDRRPQGFAHHVGPAHGGPERACGRPLKRRVRLTYLAPARRSFHRLSAMAPFHL